MTLLQSMHVLTRGAAAFLLAIALGAIPSVASSESTDRVSQLIVHFAPAAQPRAGAVIGEPKRAELQRLIGQPISAAEPMATGDQIIRLTTPLSTWVCPAATIPVYRICDSRADSNHRYTTSSAIRAQMEAMGWIAEGYGPHQVLMCAAQ